MKCLVAQCDTQTQACLAQTSKAMYWAVKPKLTAIRRAAIQATKASLHQRLQGSLQQGGNHQTETLSSIAPKMDLVILQIVSTMLETILLRFHRD